jgi:gas vesicle protein
MSKQENISNKAKAFAEIPGMSSGVIGSAENYADNVILGAERGHGFAAEKANHLHDVFTGKEAKIVGGDNVKNGADRLVDGVYIQTKYCNSGSKCIAEAFENGQFRYWNADGTPMQIEVPSDMYESAIQAMEERIKKGQVAGVTDPAKAKEIVRKGNYTYAQVRNIARFGTIESITYDAVNGIKIAGTAMGISSAISFAVSIWNGEQWDIALENACYDGLKVGGIAWVSSLLTAQLGRTGIEQGLRGGTDWVVRQMGPKAAAWLANGLRSGSNIYGAAAMNHVSKLLRGNIVTGVVVTFVLSSVDFVRIFNGRVSGAQLFKNVTTTAASVAGGTGGWMGGAAAGAAIGSAIPILGTAAGGIIGGILGSLAGGFAASTATSSILDTFIEDDAKEMLKKIEAVFGQLAEDYLLTEKEAKLVIDEFQQRDMPDTLRDMYASNNRHEFARNILEPLIEGQAKNRKKIKLPDDSEVIKQVANIIENLAAAPA